MCFAANAKELVYYFSYAKEANYITDAGTTAHSDRYSLTPTGWEETQRLPTLESSDAFVAMSFAKDSPLLKQAWQDAIKPALEEDAGYRPSGLTRSATWATSCSRSSPGSKKAGLSWPT